MSLITNGLFSCVLSLTRASCLCCCCCLFVFAVVVVVFVVVVVVVFCMVIISLRKRENVVGILFLNVINISVL